MTEQFSREELEEALSEIRARRRNPSRPLPLALTVCKDCPIPGKMYLIYSEALKLALAEEQIEVSREWFCHCRTGQACRGNAEYLGIVDQLQENPAIEQ